MRILIEFVKINQVAFEEGMKLNMGQILVFLYTNWLYLQ
jgi:hypothetical protein